MENYNTHTRPMPHASVSRRPPPLRAPTLPGHGSVLLHEIRVLAPSHATVTHLACTLPPQILSRHTTRSTATLVPC